MKLKIFVPDIKTKGWQEIISDNDFEILKRRDKYLSSVVSTVRALDLNDDFNSIISEARRSLKLPWEGYSRDKYYEVEEKNTIQTLLRFLVQINDVQYLD